MLALVLRELKQPLQLEDRPPLQAKQGEVVVDLRAAALNRRDFWITQGLYPGVQFPVVLGSDGAGVVTSVGDGVDSDWAEQDVLINPGWSWGDRQDAQADLFEILGMPGDGTFATQVVVPAESLHAKPAYLSWAEAAALPLAGLTAYRAVVSQGEVIAGENVLVTGIGGGVATFALQFANALGAQVFVTSSSSAKLARARELGAIDGFDYTSDDWSSRLNSNHGAMNLVIDSAGGDGYEQLMKLAAPGGRIVSYGATTGMPKKLDLFKLFWKQLRLIGSTMGSPNDFSAMLDLVTKHEIRPVIDEVLPLEAGNDAIERMRTSTQFGKLVLQIQP